MNVEDGKHVFHPYHGVGILTGTNVEKKILGRIKKFFEVRFNRKQFNMMFSDFKSSMMSRINSRSELNSMLSRLKNYDVKIEVYPKNSLKRFDLFLDLLKTGNLFKVAECFKAIKSIQENVRLSKQEKNLMEVLENSMCDIIVCLKGVTFSEAHDHLGAFI